MDFQNNYARKFSIKLLSNCCFLQWSLVQAHIKLEMGKEILIKYWIPELIWSSELIVSDLSVDELRECIWSKMIQEC